MRNDIAMNAPSTTIAHLVTPYLFQTGSWIHSQLTHNRDFRPIVVTQRLENATAFSFDPVFDLAPHARGAARPWFLFSKFVLGRLPAGPYREIFAREEVRLVHAHLGWEGARTAHLARSPRLPFVVSFYGQDAGPIPRKVYWRSLYKRLFAVADRVLAEGPHMGRVLAEIGAPADRVRVVHLGIPLQEFPFSERRDSGDDPVVGLIAASFREKKGIIYSLEAVARLARKHPRLRLRIIGDGPLHTAILARTQAPDLAGRVALLGYQPYPVYKQELARAHFLMAPSVTAVDGDTEGGAPVCLMEAQASGLPVVATTHCDIPEVTRPGRSALLAPERDPAALAACLDELLSHPERWPEMGRAGRAHIEAEFDIDRQVSQMNEVYRELL
jgi:colanic acid/amylovoran biosynthesis glycosyltransferase